MSTNKTENLGLNQWVRSDPFRMEDFNEDNAKIDAAVAAKAEQTALDAEAAARKSADDTKAPIASPTFTGTPKAPTASSTSNSTQIATTAFVKTAVNALTGRVGTLEKGQLLWTFDVYTGDGTHNSSNPRRIEFPFKPLVVFIADTVSVYFGGFPWVNGAPYGHSYLSSGGGTYARLTWEDRAVTFYCPLGNANAEYHLDVVGRKYQYFALGIGE